MQKSQIFEDGRKDPKSKNAGRLEKLRKAGNRFSVETSKDHSPLTS